MRNIESQKTKKKIERGRKKLKEWKREGVSEKIKGERERERERETDRERERFMINKNKERKNATERERERERCLGCFLMYHLSFINSWLNVGVGLGIEKREKEKA